MESKCKLSLNTLIGGTPLLEYLKQNPSAKCPLKDCPDGGELARHDATSGGESASPMHRYIRLLKQAGGPKLDPESDYIAMISRSAFYSARVNTIITAKSALQLFEELIKYPRTETRADAEAKLGITIDGPFPGATGAQRALLLTAFKKSCPHVLKLPLREKDVDAELALMSALGTLPPGCALVPVEEVRLRDSSVHKHTTDLSHTRYDSTPLRRGLLMPQLSATCVQIGQSSACLDATVVCRIGERVFSALQYIHSKGFGHCDVKPANMLLDHAGRAFLSDYGSSRKLGQDLNGAGTPLYQPWDGRTVATPEFDFACLVASLLEIHGRRLPPLGHLDRRWLRDEAAATEEPLRALLVELLAQNSGHAPTKS